ncbi:hypothetical protein ACU4GD_08315 [Cupriavidus basilensis]
MQLRGYRCNVERDPGVDVGRRRWDGYRAFRVASLVKEAREVTSVFSGTRRWRPDLPDQPGSACDDPADGATRRRGDQCARIRSPARPAVAGPARLLHLRAPRGGRVGKPARP